MNIRRKGIALLAFALLGLVVWSLAETEARLTKLENGVLRLHILADSDSDIDQANKLAVRDALLARSAEWMYQAETRAEALEELEGHIPEIEAIARETLQSRGSEIPVRARICKTEFPIRTYGAVTLPAGVYDALRVELGTASGKNWWCVMYPSLCVPVASDSGNSTASGSALMHERFDEGVCALAEHPKRYTVRLKCVELIRGLRGYLIKGEASDENKE